MITLITGTPGAGKTLYALNYVKALAERENRPVFYNGISELKLGWSELDKGEDWHVCPSGSIVLIDECQRVFRPRGNGAAVPEHVAKLETHRHDGIDLVLITQHPMLVESNVRRLVGRHFHVMRNFGLKSATVHEWSSTKEGCDKNRNDSVKHLFSYPVKSFDWYKSAEVHTYKARIPVKLWVFAALPIVLGAIIYGMVQWQKSRVSVTKESSNVISTGQLNMHQEGVKVASVDPMQWYKEQTPRIVGMPHTAPVYDQLARPVAMPIPHICIASESKCLCHTEQGTRILEMQDSVCRNIAQYGFFNPYRSGRRDSGLSEANPNPGTQIAL